MKINKLKIKTQLIVVPVYLFRENLEICFLLNPSIILYKQKIITAVQTTRLYIIKKLVNSISIPLYFKDRAERILIRCLMFATEQPTKNALHVIENLYLCFFMKKSATTIIIAGIM